jgi:hypothetical protein
MTPTLPQAPQAPAPAKRPGSINPWVLGCVVVPAALLVIGAFLGVLGWRKFVSYGIATDFTEYHAQVRQMDLAPEVRKPLLERFEKLRDKGRASPISFWRWVDYDQSIKSFLADGKLTPDEVEALNRELDRMEAEFH